MQVEKVDTELFKPPPGKGRRIISRRLFFSGLILKFVSWQAHQRTAKRRARGWPLSQELSQFSLECAKHFEAEALSAIPR